MQWRLLVLGAAVLPLSCFGDYMIELGVDRDSGSGKTKSQSEFIGPDLIATVGSLSSIATQVVEVESSIDTLWGKLYFGPVRTADLPLAEAGLFSRQSKIGLRMATGEGEVQTTRQPNSYFFGTQSVSSSSRGMGVSSDVEFVTSGMLPFIVGFGLAAGESETDIDSPQGRSEHESDFRASSLQLGLFVSDWTTVRYRYAKHDTARGGGLDGDSTTHSFLMRRLVSLGQGRYLSASARYAVSADEYEGISSTEKRDMLGIRFNYYPARDWQLSLAYGESSQVYGRAKEEYHYGLSYFFNDAVALSLQVSKADLETPAFDTVSFSAMTSEDEMASDGVRLGLGLRF